jgi:hypothetical protein
MIGRDKAYEGSLMDTGLIIDLLEVVAVALVAVSVVVIIIDKK